MSTTTASTATASIREEVLAGPHGDLRVRVYRPGSGAPAAGLVWAHGGAFMHGDLDMPEADHVARVLAAGGVAVVSVDYALAPAFDHHAVLADDGLEKGLARMLAATDGARFPVASQELAFAFAWAVDADLGVPAGGWSLGGASAGGNLAAGVALRLRDAAAGDTDAAPVPPSSTARTVPRSVVLAYPVAHHELPDPWPELATKIAALPPDRSYPPAAVRAMNDHYLGHERGPDSPYAFPAGHDLRGLPPTLIVTSDHDALRSSGEAYAAELAVAGTDVMVVREDDTLHGHLNQPDDPGCARSLARISAWLTSDVLVGTTHEPPA
ncbi:alpha/beta hydrolase fold domain-containing protein [Isoptericola haloaureus]|uniref:Alpha/beta hydrolase fold domain-containing protein n=1 Tax=Isoptericola haloaureus TaxID=1542902 RepID=A0ABU7Z989_9MICO